MNFDFESEIKESISIKKRYNLIIGFSGPYGAGSSSLANELRLILNEWLGVTVKYVKVFDEILHYAERVIPMETKKLPGLVLDKKRKQMQRIGTLIRKKDPEIVGKLIVRKIFSLGTDVELVDLFSSEIKPVSTWKKKAVDEYRGFQKARENFEKLTTPLKLDKEEVLEKKRDLLSIRRKDKSAEVIVYLVDSIKNANEFHLLKRVFGDEFHLVFVHLNRETRFNRLVSHNSWDRDKRTVFDECDEIDRDESEVSPSVKNSGQQVRKISHLADYYVVNNNNLETLKNDGIRLLQILFGETSVLPTIHESCMHIAFSSGSRSFCLSRQVGAVLAGPRGEVISIGHNDVPRAGGGVYSREDRDFDQRCYNCGERSCANDLQKKERFNKLGDSILKIIQRVPDIKKNGSKFEKLIRAAISNSEFKRATEFCRAVHAEMACILAAKPNSFSLKDCTLYVTTQPCHNCTKHIICSGIGRVIFIEPYPKSLAMVLHGEAILFDPEGDESRPDSSRIFIVPYAGVSPRKYSDYFNRIGEIKVEGKMVRKSRDKLNESPAFARRIEKRDRLKIQNTQSNAITQGEVEIVVELKTPQNNQKKEITPNAHQERKLERSERTSQKDGRNNSSKARKARS